MLGVVDLSDSLPKFMLTCPGFGLAIGVYIVFLCNLVIRVTIRSPRIGISLRELIGHYS